MAKLPINKTTTVPVKKTAPKKVPVKVAVKAAAPKAPVVKAPVVKKVAAKKVAVKKVAAPKAAADKAPAAKAPVTTVIAKLDAGFGNELYIRGNGANLSWEAGVLMSNTGADEWIWESGSVTGELEFKVLLNDSLWASGPNGVVFPGSTVVFEPVF